MGETTTGIRVAIAAAVDAQISSSMEVLFCHLQNLPANPSLQLQHFDELPPSAIALWPTSLLSRTGCTVSTTLLDSSPIAIGYWASYMCHHCFYTHHNSITSGCRPMFGRHTLFSLLTFIQLLRVVSLRHN
uniref:Uncharacterized protein n=1 Tax=Cucumis melo TaxID=3656 RepID=A0A9I9D1F7_CUCME